MSVTVEDDLEKSSKIELNILVVDDDALNQRMMELILRREGYNTLVASNGMEAVELVKTHNFDVVLMDLQMPVMDGIHASRQIREWEKDGRHTYIVALTASFLPEKGQELFDAGIDNYISKPFDLEHLHQILRYSYDKVTAAAKSEEKHDSFTSGISFETGLQRVGGSEDIYKELLSDFIQELPGKMERLQYCRLNNELELLSRLAHNLKGVSANLGAMRLSEWAGNLEKKVDSGFLDEIEHIIDAVWVAADEFQNSATNYLAG